MYEIKIPKEIKIGGIDFAIKMDEVTHISLNDRSNRGEHSDRCRLISIDNSLSSQDISITFTHECCHAVDSIYCNNELSEYQIRGMAHGIHQVLEQLGIRFVR